MSIAKRKDFISTYLMLCKLGFEIEENSGIKEFYKREIRVFEELRKGEFI